MNQLIAYLLEHAMLDFSGDLTQEMVRDFLRDDGSREAADLLTKIAKDQGVDDMLLTLADCLKDYLRTGVHEETVREQLKLYADS